jgi:hypothetical protein
MKHVFVSLLMIAVGAFGLINADNIRALYADLSPDFTAKTQALDVCAGVGSNLDQLTVAGRDPCSGQSKIAPSAVRVSIPREDARRHLPVQH